MRVGSLSAVGTALCLFPLSVRALNNIVNNDDGFGSANIREFYRLLNAATQWWVVDVEANVNAQPESSSHRGFCAC